MSITVILLNIFKLPSQLMILKTPIPHKALFLKEAVGPAFRLGSGLFCNFIWQVDDMLINYPKRCWSVFHCPISAWVYDIMNVDGAGYLLIIYLMIFTSPNEKRSKSRSQSAKVSYKPSRPASGVSSRQYQKTQTLEGIYKQRQAGSPIRRTASKNIINQNLFTQDLGKFRRAGNPPSTTKEREELFQENMKLKKTINKLNDELSICKSRMEVKSKKSIQKSKQLDIEFQKPLYWGGTNAHLISGIKHQYEKLKKQHSDLKVQYEEMKVALMESKAPEYRIYADAILEENIRLAQKIEKMQQATPLSIQNNSQRLADHYLLEEAEQNTKRLQKKLQELDIQLKNANEHINEKDKKLMFLEKLIIEKDNREYHTGLKAKKCEKAREMIHDKYEGLKKKYHEMKEKHEKDEENLNRSWEKMWQQREGELHNQIKARDARIQTLEEDQRKMEEAFNRMKVSSTSSGLPGLLRKNSINSMGGNTSGVQGQNNFSSTTKLGQFLLNSNIAEQDENNLMKYDSTYSQQMPLGQQYLASDPNSNREEKPRTMQRADIKHSQNSKKTRKVNHSDVEEIGQLAKYRLLHAKIDSNGLKELFNYKRITNTQQDKERLELEAKTEQKEVNLWEEEHITMSEVISILRDSPLNISEEQAEILARYVIQDCDEEYVYCDMGNQNKREVVKSIMKTVVGEYQLPDSESITIKFDDFMSKYSENISLALKALYPKGLVSKKKILDVIDSVGAEVPEEVKNELIGRLASNSSNLLELKYDTIFAY